MAKAKYLNVNEVASELQISKQTLVRYENKGVFPRPKRNNLNNWREYTTDDVRLLRVIMGRVDE
ncbi:MAG: MerR family transcriptional regulator [Candidatus Omnitrophica bacterium]|nr:MerR family transcriptional regulator [Candidatus Omnitrophota bacterium]